MSALQNPVKINRLWKKINDRFGPDEEEDEKKLTGRARDAAKQRKKVDKGLNVLKILSRGGVKTPAKIKKFESNRAKLLKGMKKYCKLLKGSKIEGLQNQTKYRKSVLQLTVVIEELSPTQVTDEEGDEDINALLGIETDRVESSLDDPALDVEDDEDFDVMEEEAEEAAEEESGKAPPAPPPPPESMAGIFKTRMQSIKTRYQEITAIKPPVANLSQMVNLMNAILTSGGKKDFTQGLLQLDQLEAEMNKAGGTPPPAPPPPKAPPTADQAAEFKAKLAEWSPAIKAAMAAKGPNAAAIAKLLAQATALSKPGGDMVQALDKLTECHALATGSAEEEEEEGEEETPTTHMGTWNQTKDRADAQINKLCDYLRKTHEEALVEVASKLAAAMDMFKVDLTTSLMGMDRANAEQKKKLFPKVSQIIANYKQSLQANQLLSAAEDNPFVPVDVKKPLLAALDRIQKNLEAQVGA